MANAGTTKRALFASILSLIVCCAMLIGSTFAWLTDSVTSGKNTIVAGNLNISAEVFDPAVYGDEACSYDTSIITLSPGFFNGSLGDSDDITVGFPEKGTDLKDCESFFANSENSPLEPGATVLKLLRIYNNGDLAVKLSLHFDVVDGGLQDVLWFSVNWSSDVYFYNNNDEPTKNGQYDALPMADLSSTLSDVEIIILPEGEDGSQGYQDIYFAFGMAENADLGYQGKSFNASLSVLATQYTYESDTFDDQYDAMAFDDMTAEMNRLRVDMSLKTLSEDMDIETVDTDDSKLIQVYTYDIYPGSKTTFIFTVTGVAAEAETLSFDFDEKCDAGGSYKGVYFEYGFGGYDDIYLVDGDYENPDYAGGAFTLVGNYHPVVLTVTPGAENNNKFFYQGTLDDLVKELSNGFEIEAGKYYDNTFTVTVEWPYYTDGTEDCYIKQNGTQVENDEDGWFTGMNLADNYLGYAAAELVGWGEDYGCLELWADFEVMLKSAG